MRRTTIEAFVFLLVAPILLGLAFAVLGISLPWYYWAGGIVGIPSFLTLLAIYANWRDGIDAPQEPTPAPKAPHSAKTAPHS